MNTKGTYFQNSKTQPLCYGEVQLMNPPRRRLRGEPEKIGVEAAPVFCGFCGTDNALLHMGACEALDEKFPAGQTRLINGHEGVVYVPKLGRFAIVLIRGGDSCDPTRFTEDETYFEYGCDKADGLFCDRGFFHPDMLLPLPKPFDQLQKLPLSLAKKLVFADPYACAIFQYERMCDIGEAQNFRVVLAKTHCTQDAARKQAVAQTFARTVIFGLGTAGLFIGDQIRRHQPNAHILFVARSGADSEKAVFARKMLHADYLSTDGLTEAETAARIRTAIAGTASVFVGTSGAQTEHRIAFAHGVLGCNGIYNSFSLGPAVTFDTMPFGFKNQVILSSINFTQKHMEAAIEILASSAFDRLVACIDKTAFIRDPADTYQNKIYCKDAPLKTAVIWNEAYIDTEK